MTVGTITRFMTARTQLWVGFCYNRMGYLEVGSMHINKIITNLTLFIGESGLVTVQTG